MALTLEDALKVKQRCLADTRTAGTQSMLRTLFSHISQMLKNPNLQYVALSGLNAADVVVSDVACKVYAIVGRKPDGSTTDAWLKGSDHATTAAANGDFVVKFIGTDGENRTLASLYPDGLLLGTGFTVGSHTTVSGNTKSASADAPVGFAIVGSP
jgi:hypothetical protein